LASLGAIVLDANVTALESRGDSLVIGAEPFEVIKRGPQGKSVVVGLATTITT